MNHADPVSERTQDVEGLLRKLVWHGAVAALLLADDRVPGDTEEASDDSV